MFQTFGGFDMEMRYKKLFEPGKIGNLEIKNRIVMPPMGVGYSDGDGKVSKRQIAYFEERAKGGVGIITTSAFMIDEDLGGIAESNEAFIFNENARDSIRELINAVQKHDARIIIQLLHPGRQGSAAHNKGLPPVAPSAIKEADFLEMPRELTIAEIQELVGKFIAGAKTAYDLGADGVEVHGAHGYLINQFMSKRANHRTDEYGGSFEKRMRFVTEIVEGIKAIKPVDRILSVRINGTDGIPDGLSVEDCIEIATYLERLGVDVISLSSGTYSDSGKTIEPAICEEGCKTYFVKAIKDKLKIPVIATNNIKRPETADKLLADGVSDFVALGRASFADSAFSKKALAGTKSIRTCISCGSCMDTYHEEGVKCAVNPFTGREYSYNDSTIVKNGNGRLIVVIGGGPGGIQSAVTAAKRGFAVKLFDNNHDLGGALLLASKGKGKDKVEWSLNGMIEELHDLGVEIVLNSEIKDVSQVEALNPYAVVIATGGKPIKPPIPGLDRNNVYLAHDILKKDIGFENKKIAIVGSGMTGLETAEVLLDGSNKIVMYDMLDEIAKGANLINKTATMAYLAENGVDFKTEHRLVEVNDKGLILENMANGEKVVDDSDIIVLSLGVKPDKTLEQALAGSIDKLVTVGDCAGGGKIYHATQDGLLKVWNI
jgi:2,4-dienoyl-CoA reductase-like NADH-dependent reductase (Old Yellow Enzyme family)/thioredoxin reductase